ncbi:hypothetical protein GIB67_009251 [Kingdonia uniflora]|uniref:Nucleolar GTP-binding protein 2 N-terminal domain-containing protein n=1 Tax=Kingdonia uniflora TaxID=39325 RepID=A0A7J7N2W3_9MAGN|nr:hypothetical protein GIB67_009251 [Kingdonia uniflora]
MSLILSVFFPLGNTRVVDQNALTMFRKKLQKIQSNTNIVILRERKLPMSLLNDYQNQARVHLLDTEPFEDAFGPKGVGYIRL